MTFTKAKPIQQKPAVPNRLLKRAGIALAALAVVVLLVLAAKWFRGTVPGQDFIATYPGHVDLPAGAPVGLPAWLGWQHFLNAFFMLLIIRSGWLVRTTTRPKAYWTRNNKGLLRTKGAPKKISLDLWLHLSLDVLWVLNGAIFFIMLFATRQWMRIVPTSWQAVPNAASALLQYASFNWPLDDGWVNYNSLQVMAYFLTIFVAAPLALASGLRMSPVWPKNTTALNKAYPIELARAVHVPVMVYFVFFIIVHVGLVLTTGALRNLNHMFAATDDGGWLGFWLFAVSVVVMALGWVVARPMFLGPVASLSGKVGR